MSNQKPRETGGWLGGFIFFACFVALIFLIQIPVIGAALGWIFTGILGLILAIYLAGLAVIALGGFGHWFAGNPLLAVLKLIFWPFYALLLLFQKAN